MTEAEKIIKRITDEVKTEAHTEGMQQGKESERIFSIKSIMKNLELTAEKAMDVLSIPKAERGKYKALL